jgi:hypothetical protein
MNNEQSRPAEVPKPKKKMWVYIGILLVVIVVIAIVAITSIPSIMPTPKINQVLIKVEYSGAWQGAYGDQTGVTSWSSQGSKTITLNRPSEAEHIWIISANAQKMDGSGDNLRIMITKTDGTVLKEGSTTAPYGVAQITYTIQD